MKFGFKYLLVILLLSLTACLIACGGGSSPDEPPSEQPSEIPDNLNLSGIIFSGREFYYDGHPHGIYIRGKIPEGVSAKYENNDKINAGTYTVTAKFYYNDIYLEGADRDAEITINKASFSTSAISFKNAVFPYDGKPHYLVAENLPKGLTPKYTGNGMTEIGVYHVSLEFDYDEANYNPPPTFSAKMTVTPAAFTEEGLELVKNSQGQYEVLRYTADSEYVVIAPEYDGVPVVSVRGGAFANNEKISYVYLPDSVLNIGSKAFFGCSNLDTLLYSDRLISIGASAFEGTAIKALTLPDSLKVIGFGALKGTHPESLTLPFIGGSANSDTGYLGYIFGADGYGANKTYVPSQLKELTLSDSAEAVPPYALYGCSAIERINLGKSVRCIGISAFGFCSSLAEINLPAVEQIPAEAFYYNSPFVGCNDNLIITIGEGCKTDSFGRFWNYVSEGKTARIKESE